MKIVLDLPEWVDERHIRIFAGIELAAIKEAHQDFFRIKVDRCVMCGKCCTGLKRHHLPLINGECVHLAVKDKQGKRTCNIAINRPFPCGNDPREGDCENITYRKVPCK